MCHHGALGGEPLDVASDLGRGPEPDLEFLGRRTEIDLDRAEIDIVRRTFQARGVGEEVVEDRFAVDRSDEKKPAAAKTGEQGLGNA